MEKITYEDWKARAKAAAGNLESACKAMGISRTDVYHSGKRNAGVVDLKFCCMLVGLEFERDEFLQQCRSHRSNKALEELIQLLKSNKGTSDEG